MAETDFSVIIIGAGAAGLLAARELSAAGFSVLVLEAANAPGGRILTLEGEGFSGPVEAGAEFVHGDLPLTLQLLKEGRISYRPVRGRMVQVQKGKWGKRNMFDGQWSALMQKMEALEEQGQDLPIGDFLVREFSGEKYAGLRGSVQRFAEGYDLADVAMASTLALYREWQEEGQEEYRIDGGYGRLVQFLADECRAAGCLIQNASPAKEIRWQPGRAEVVTADGRTFSGGQLIVTVSLGILQMEPSQPASSPASVQSSSANPSPLSGQPAAPEPASVQSPGSLRFFPPIPGYLQAARQLGYGSVTKILMEFSQPFWQEKGKDISFILSDEPIPTWWLQSPQESSLVTGWLTGAVLKKFRELDYQARIDLCLQSLASIFGRDIRFLQQQLMRVHIADWPSAPYIKGGYSFDTVESGQARKVLRQPIQETLFFAGEALYEGPSPGTVEAAFTSGKEVAEKIQKIRARS